MRPSERAERAIRQIDEYLSSKKLQRSTRKQLLQLRSDFEAIRDEKGDRHSDLPSQLLRWAVLLSKLYELVGKYLY
jgi:hypothetical protein